MENMIANLGYWSKASLGSSIGVSTFLFFDFGDCLAFRLPLTLELTATLKDWYQSYKLIRSPCSCDNLYLYDKSNVLIDNG